MPHFSSDFRDTTLHNESEGRAARPLVAQRATKKAKFLQESNDNYADSVWERILATATSPLASCFPFPRGTLCGRY